MAARAARAGHLVRGCDAVTGRAAFAAADGVRPMDTVAPAVGGADLTVDLVTTRAGGEVEEALFAPGGAAGSLAFSLAVTGLSRAGAQPDVDREPSASAV